MKPKLNDEEKKELMNLVINKLKYCQSLLDEAYKHHCVATEVDGAINKARSSD